MKLLFSSNFPLYHLQFTMAAGFINLVYQLLDYMTFDCFTVWQGVTPIAKRFLEEYVTTEPHIWSMHF